MPPDRLRSPRPSLFAASHAPSAAGRGKAVSLPVQPTRILIVGNGGREHALAWKLAPEPGVNDVFVTEGRTDRKSTRLNSSHLVISYAVFCFKKKKKQRQPQ